jgi:hypothetical protein
MQQIILELPLLGYVFSPDSTKDRVDRFKAWMARRGRTVAVIGAAVIGLWLVISGIVALA